MLDELWLWGALFEFIDECLPNLGEFALFGTDLSEFIRGELAIVDGAGALEKVALNSAEELELRAAGDEFRLLPTASAATTAGAAVVEVVVLVLLVFVEGFY